MSTTHTLPIPPHLLRSACDVICRTAGMIPFKRQGARVTRELVAAAMEELNAEATRMLALSARTTQEGTILLDGLDRHLVLRGFSEKDSTCIAKVLIGSGIAARASVTVRRSRQFVQAVRLAAPWTWTIAGEFTGPAFLPADAGGEDDESSWTSVCPVCRHGRLDPVTGEQLYGLSRTDFLACTSCGAKFVPDSGKFRLVAIVLRKDPQWCELLNKAHTPAEWQHLAKAGSLPGNVSPASRARGGRDAVSPRSDRTAPETLALEIGNRTLFFTRVPVRFLKRTDGDRFTDRRETLRTLLNQPAFAHVWNVSESRYRPYLDVPVGYVLSELKLRGDPLYRQFLNSYGDVEFCPFRGEETPLLSRRGVYIVATGPEVLAAGPSLCPFRETIDNLLGTIPPAACYLDGDPERCRINALLCSDRNRSLYVHALSDEHEILRIATILTGKISRPCP